MLRNEGDVSQILSLSSLTGRKFMLKKKFQEALSARLLNSLVNRVDEPAHTRHSEGLNYFQKILQ